VKRVLLLAAAIVGCVGVIGATPVKADPAVPSEHATITAASFDLANAVLKGVPSPAGWKQRHVCAWVDPVDRSWCVYFPFPM
jgi:hypothetical protein